MADGYTGPPAVDFYSMLSGLGDTIAKSRQQNAIASAFQPGADGKVDFGRALGTVAQYNPSLAVAMQTHLDAQAHQAIEDKRAASNDAFTHNIQTQSLGIQQAAAKRAAYEFEHTPDQYVPNPKAAQPGEPQFIDQYAAASAANANSKPIPFETLSGTKFLVRQPNGSYAQVDPNAVGAPPSPTPQPPVQSSPTVVGDAEGVARGLYAAPAAPGQRPPIQQPSPVAPTTPVASPPVAPNAPAAPAAAAPVAAPQQPPQADLNAVDPTTGRRENWLKAQSPDVQAYIKKVADYEIDPRTTSIKGGHREQVMSAVAQYDPTYDQNTFGSRAKAIKDFSTGQQGNAIRSFDVATDHLDTLQKYVAAMKNGDIPLLNKIRNAWQQETGSSLPTNVQAVAPIVGAEVSKAIIGSNNALADREELRQPLQNSRSPEQLAGAIEAYKSLMTGQLNGLKKQYEDTTGKKNFADRLRPNTKAVLMGGEGSGTPATPSQPNVTSTGIKWSVQ
jgi:hypothetical protein